MADSELPAGAPTVETPTEQVIPMGRGKLRLLARLGVGSGVFVLAIVTSWIYREQSRDDPDSTLDQSEAAKSQGRKIDSAGSAVESLARGDEALQRQLYTAALSHYEELLVGAPSSMPLVDYRFGLCLESLGQMDRAMAAYRKSINAATTPSLTIACHLAMARCLLRQNQTAEARRLLYSFIFDESRHQGLPAVFADDARYLAALAMARENLTPITARSAEDAPVTFDSVALEIPLYLEDLGLSAPAATKSTKPSPQLVVRPRTDNQPATVARIDQPSQLAWELLDRLAKEAGMRSEWSPAAKQTVGERSLRLCLSNWPVIDILEQVADRFDLLCVVEGNAVRFVTPAELDTERQSSARRAMTQRALRAAIRCNDGHGWTPAAYLELGNADLIEGKLAEAAAWFEQLVRETPTSPYAMPGTYNLANVYLQKDDAARARQTLFRVIDQSPGHELALRAQIRIGQLYLEQDDAGPALVQLRRAQTLSPRSPYQARASLMLAAAYLQQGCPEKTRTVLAKQRPLVQKSPYKSTAAFLDAYAQYRLAKTANFSRREASELLSTLWHDQDETVLGTLGHCLIAQAYRDLGFWDQAERVLRQTAKQTRGPLTFQLSFLLGETLLKQNRRDEATRLFNQLAATASPFRGRARFQLAKLDLEDKRFQECAQKCQALWDERSMPDAAALLQVWGAALEGTGDFANAAQCFAGKAPK